MNNQKINIIVQVRMGSTRLPGKVLKPIMGRPMLSYLLERLKRVRFPHKLIIATTTNAQDDIIEAFAKKENILLFRGSEENVLDRYYQACCIYPANLVVRITSDCPLIDPNVINDAIELLQERSQLDYVSNTLHRSFPRGMDVEVFSLNALKVAWKEATSLFDREHVTPFLYKHSDRFQLANFIHEPNISMFRLTVDTPEDFLLITKIFEALYPINKKFTLGDILQVFIQHPEWKEINAHVKQKES